jgi:hypothetical protein
VCGQTKIVFTASSAGGGMPEPEKKDDDGYTGRVYCPCGCGCSNDAGDWKGCLCIGCYCWTSTSSFHVDCMGHAWEWILEDSSTVFMNGQFKTADRYVRSDDHSIFYVIYR